MTWYVYGLRASQSEPIRYIGITQNLRQRLWAHITRPHQAKLREWTQSLQGGQPELTVLAEFPDESQAFLRERELILETPDLLNTAGLEGKKKQRVAVSNGVDLFPGFGARVRAARTKAGMSERKLASLVGVTGGAIHMLETRETPRLGPRLPCAWLECLGQPLNTWSPARASHEPRPPRPPGRASAAQRSSPANEPPWLASAGTWP